MIQFNKITLSEDNQTLIVGVEIQKSSYFTDVYIDNIIIDDISSFSTSNHIYTSSLNKDYKTYTWNIPINSILTNINNNMLFITVTSKGAPSIDCPCGQDNSSTIGVFADVCSIFNNISKYSSELNKNCLIPKGFIDYLLLFKALEYALKTCNYNKAIKYWNKLQRSKSLNLTNKCACNG